MRFSLTILFTILLWYLAIAEATFAIRHPKMDELTQWLHFVDMILFRTVGDYQ